MALRLKGKHPAVGQPDRRYYMIDVQVSKRRVRLSSGTRDKTLAERRQRDIVDVLRVAPDVGDAVLRTLVRGNACAARDMLRSMTMQTESNEPLVEEKESREHFWMCLS